jgi:hypothetical protein
LWFNTRPIVLEVGLPALLMGFGFPLANALTQRADRSVGRRAGVLYFSNTCGAVWAASLPASSCRRSGFRAHDVLPRQLRRDRAAAFRDAAGALAG